jgi:photosystem II stability/assembly factor-like uncharacterized protein
MNRFLFFALCLLLFSNCRGNLIKEDPIPREPCIWQTDLPDTVGTWYIDTFSLPKNNSFYDRDIFFINEQIGYLMKNGFELYKTLNGGKSWAYISNVDNRGNADETYFINENTGFVSVYSPANAHLATTADGGKTWQFRVYDLRGTISNIHFTTDLNGFAMLNNLGNKTSDLSLIQTKNQGQTWEKIPITDSLSSQNFKLQVLDSKKLFTIATKNNQDYLLKSIDGGLTWEKLGNTPDFIHQIKFSDEQNGFLVGWHKCYTTVDGGQTWQEKIGIDGSIELLYMNSLNDILLRSETTQCNHGDYSIYQTEFLSLENKVIIGSKKVTDFRLLTYFFVNNKLGFVASLDKLLRFRR